MSSVKDWFEHAERVADKIFSNTDRPIRSASTVKVTIEELIWRGNCVIRVDGKLYEVTVKELEAKKK